MGGAAGRSSRCTRCSTHSGVISMLSGVFSAALVLSGVPPTGVRPPGANLANLRADARGHAFVSVLLRTWISSMSGRLSLRPIGIGGAVQAPPRSRIAMVLFGMYLVIALHRRDIRVRVRKEQSDDVEKRSLSRSSLSWFSARRSPRTCTSAAKQGSRSRPRPFARAISKPSCRRRARSSRSVRSTSPRIRWAASPGSRSRKASASRPASSCSRSIRGSSRDSCSAARRASPPPSPVWRRRASSVSRRRGEPRAGARPRLELSRQNLKRQQELWKDGLTTREITRTRAERGRRARGRRQGAAAGRRGPGSRKSRRANSRSSRSRRAWRRRATT